MDDDAGHARLPMPIDTIPLELLIEIFAYCAAQDPLAPLAFRSVSKWWREAGASPRIWQHIFLDDQTHSPAFLRTKAELWALRSMPLLLDIELKVDANDLILPMLSYVLPYVDRWRSLTLTGKREEFIKFPRSFPMTRESLDFLHIFIQEDDQPAPGHTVVAELPHNHHMNVWLLELPSSLILSPLRFVNITIAEDALSDMHTTPRAILDFLSACPELETFHFSGWHHNDEPDAAPLPIVSLPNLHTLHLKNTCMARAILSSLYTPMLVNLYLAHLNVEFALRGEYHEDGDSEDDAHDFSQSPSSDHATGMGLRKLIARSNPPIMVLDMDFSDMRTKDFRYIFDRLPYLQDFLIVASDMSDTVINLLRPYTLPGGIVRTRLPRLKSLNLYNCQRLSGDAIVDMLTARVKHTDKGQDTLQEVSIVTCDGFTQDHAQLLVKHLGHRLRMV